jgi:hypothetical protein
MNIVQKEALVEEHKEWAEKFGSALMGVMQEDYSEIEELAMRMVMDFSTGVPILESKALSNAIQELT